MNTPHPVSSNTQATEAEPMPPKGSKDDTTPVFDTPGGKPRHIPTTEIQP